MSPPTARFIVDNGEDERQDSTRQQESDPTWQRSDRRDRAEVSIRRHGVIQPKGGLFVFPISWIYLKNAGIPSRSLP
ncbi:hypothetical protein Aglo01_40350 [Actinokineospora globicatena]|nr:hypothetical protein Aglo01_40350 [Actinokineospora globicatena]GLW86037.1 hypothetical protein Aglo02_36760 [Actinokineospora globicatena]